MSAIGVAVLGLALVVSAVAAAWLRTRDGAVRPADDPDRTEDTDVTPQQVLADLGIDVRGADLTVVQFSTAFCAPCRQTRARLDQLRATRPGLAYVHVDAESHLDAVRELDVRRTPTLLYFDRTGAALGRSSGAPRPLELTALVDAHAPSGSRT